MVWGIWSLAELFCGHSKLNREIYLNSFRAPSFGNTDIGTIISSVDSKDVSEKQQQVI